MIARIYWIAANTVVELLKDRVMQGLLFVGVFLILCGHIVAEMSVVERTRMIIDAGLGSIFLVGVLAVLFAGANLLDREIRERQVLCILSKPITRSAWLAGKTLGLILVVAALVFVLILFLMIFLRLETGAMPASLLVAGMFIFLMLLVLTGYAVLFSTITSQFMALFFGFLVVIIGHMVDDLKIYWASDTAGAQFTTKLFYYILPDLKMFSAWRVVSPVNPVTGSDFLVLIVYALAFLIVTLVLASIILERKEFE